MHSFVSSAVTRKSSAAASCCQPSDMSHLKQLSALPELLQQKFCYQPASSLGVRSSSSLWLLSELPKRPLAVAKALRDLAARQEANNTYGNQWLETKDDLWPADTFKNDEFIAYYYQVKQSGIAGPSNAPWPTPSTSADLLASALCSAFLLGKVASDSLPGSVRAPSRATLLFLSQLHLLASTYRLTSQSQASSPAMQMTLIFVLGSSAGMSIFYHVWH